MFGPCIPNSEKHVIMGMEARMSRTYHLARPNISQTFGRSPCTFPTVAAVQMTQGEVLETYELCGEGARAQSPCLYKLP